MPLFRRRTADFAAPTGTLPCRARGCLNQTGIECGYTDRHGKVCGAAFCPEHRATVRGVIYCRRHSSTMAALGGNAQTLALPELDSRAASLVSWIADSLEADISALLEEAARPNERVTSDREVTVVLDANRQRRWERGWKLIENTGVSLKVSLQVSAGRDDALVEARVGAFVVARGVPPWVARRRAGVDVTEQGDAEQRDLFRRFFLDHIAAEVINQRAEERADRATLAL
jgi:hypothetical protein